LAAVAVADLVVVEAVADLVVVESMVEDLRAMLDILIHSCQCFLR
jgi:hypothetical protein